MSNNIPNTRSLWRGRQVLTSVGVMIGNEADRQAYLDALQRMSNAQDAWAQARLPIQRLSAGQVPQLPREQLAAEVELGAAWQAYKAARDRYYGRTGTPT